MIKKKINKRKTSFILLLKIFSFIIFLSLIILLINKLYEGDFIKKKSIFIIEKFSKDYDYTLNKIKIVGTKKINKSEIKSYFDQYYYNSIFLIPIEEISKNILKNNWVKNISITSNFKDTLDVNIVEYIPVGIFYNNKSYLFFDKDGKIIDFLYSNIDNHSQLIIFKGNKSLFNAIFFLDEVPVEIKNDIKEAHFINNRRWDIVLKNGIYLKISEKNILESFKKYKKLNENLSNEELAQIKSIDLRILKKAIIKLKVN